MIVICLLLRFQGCVGVRIAGVGFSGGWD